MSLRLSQPIDPAVYATDYLLNNYHTVPECGCWLWAGNWNEGGYGRLRRRGHGSIFAHRLFYTVHKGEIPNGLLVCHRCDTPACVNPDHLFLGSNVENMRDRKRKGHFDGEWNGRAILSAGAVREVRASGQSSRRLAKSYGVSRRTIRGILNGSHWGNVA